MPDQIWLGQFNIVAGQVQEDGPYAATITDRSVAEAVADLYLVIQPTRPDNDGICAEVVQAINSIFGHSQYSITGNLLLALGKAHQYLRDWNRSSLPEHRIGIGISCLAIAGDEAYLAQAGPSTVFYRHNGRIEQLEPLEADARRPLGDGDGLAPWFYRLKLAPSDSILLLTGDLGARLDIQALDGCLALAPDVALPEVFRLSRSERNCGAVLVGVLRELTPTAVHDASAPRTAMAAPGTPPAPPTGRATDAPPPNTPRRAEPPLRPGQPPQRPRRAPSPLGRNHALRVQAEHPDAGRGVIRVLGQRAPDARIYAAAPLQLVAPGDTLAGGKAQRTILRVRGGQPSFRTAFPGFGFKHRSRLVAGLVGVAAFAATLYLGVPALVNSGRAQRFTSALHSAQTEVQSAQSTNDLARRRELLTKALTHVDEAQRLNANSQAASDTAATVNDALTTLNAVYTVPEVPVLADLTNVGLSTSSAVELAAGDRLYVLDQAAGKVFAAVEGGAAPQVIFEDGSSVDGITAGKAQHIAWLPPSGAGDRGSLLILDTTRHLFAVSAGTDLHSLLLPGVDQWRGSSGLAFSGDSLYVLDAPGAQVWRYRRSDTGFALDLAPAVTKPDLRDATGISVINGIFLTGADGHIRRYLDGQEDQFKLKGIDQEPLAPQPPLYDLTTGALYIADRGNSRVIVLQADGVFQRQLVNTRLNGLRSLAVDSGHHRLIGVVAQTVVAIPLPQ